MRASEAERDRRYETATGMARVIERFLSDEAVEGCPPSYGYRFKFGLKASLRVFCSRLIG